MSSPSTDPYKSRLFNLINRQSLHLRDRWDRTAQNLRVAAEWGVQILLYPVYLLVQTGRIAGHQLQQTFEQAQLPVSTAKSEDRQQPPTADKPIEQVLKAVESGLLAPYSRKSSTVDANLRSSDVSLGLPSEGLLPSLKEWMTRIWQQALAPVQKRDKEDKGDKGDKEGEEKRFLSINLRQPLDTLPQKTVAQSSTGLKQATEISKENCLVIQGVATLLETRTLVLVTRDNQILDILSQQQQQKLQQCISWEVAEYWNEQRLAQTATKKLPGRLPMFKKNSANVLPPVRFFWKVMGWVQTSSVAIAVNLFEESTFASPLAPSPPPTSPKIAPPLIPTEVLATLDDTIADLEEQQLVPTAQVVQNLGAHFQELLQNLQTRLSASERATASPEASDPHSFEIQALIQAAIDYFFGKLPEQFRPQGNDPSAAIPPHQSRATPSLSGSDSLSLPKADLPEQQLLAASEEDPWLSWDDLFSDAGSAVVVSEQLKERSPSSSPDPAQLPKASQTPLKPENPPLESIKPNLNWRQKSKSFQSSQPASKDLAQPQNHPSTVAPSSRTSAQVTQSQPEDSTLESAPDWVETEATPIGYVKHPLERILEWLDWIVLWLEELVANIWRWARKK